MTSCTQKFRPAGERAGSLVSPEGRPQPFCLTARIDLRSRWANEEEVQQRVEEEVQQGRTQIEEQVQEERTQIEQEAQEAQQKIEQEAKEVQQQVEEKVGGQ